MKTRLGSLLLTAGLATLGIAGTAQAASVSYLYNTPFAVPNNTGIAGINLVLTVPTGRPPVQAIEMTQVRPSFPGGGGADVSYKLRSPGGQEMFTMLNSCPMFPNTSNFSIRDGAADQVGQINFCNNQVNGGVGRPDDPDGKTFASTFAGIPSAGNWTFNVRDIGLNATQGTLNGWGIKITHAPLTVTASAKKQRVTSKAKVKVSCNANCSVATKGDAKAKTFAGIDQGETQKLAIPIKGKALSRVEEGGKLTVKLSVTDEIGDVVTKKVKVKVTA